MAIISETELQRRLRALEKGAGGGGTTTVVNANDPYGTGYTSGSQWYNSTTNNLWVFNGSDWELSFSKLYLRYADAVSNVDQTGHVSNQIDVTGFSEYPFDTLGNQKLWRGIYLGGSTASNDSTDYEWTYTAGESGDTPSFERYYTVTAGLMSEIGDPTTPGSGVTWVSGSSGIPSTAFWIAERYTLDGVTSDWQVYPVQAKDGGIPFVKYVKGTTKPTLGDSTWIADAILAVEAFTGRDYSTQKEFGYGTVVVIDYTDGTLAGKYTRSGGVDTWVAPGSFIDGDLIVDGTIVGDKVQANSIDATKIDSRGLSIKDAAGNIILAAGSPLDVGNVSGLGTLATANTITMSSVTDAGALATADTITTSLVTDAGALATLNNINLSYVTDSGAMAAIDAITASNVSTYIANAAIGNAQIGGAIQSTNFATGSAGWQIDKAGTAEFNNVTVRGTVDSSVISASYLGVDSLRILTNGSDYAPFSFASTVNYQGGTTSLTLNFDRVYSPTYGSGYLATRVASLTTPAYITMAQHGDYNTVTASLQVSYDGGSYTTLASTSAYLDYRSGLALAYTFVPSGSWSYYDLRWVFSGSQTNQVSSQALVINGT